MHDVVASRQSSAKLGNELAWSAISAVRATKFSLLLIPA
jgi:hypothetical protein